MTAHGMWRSRRNPRRATRCVWIPPWGGGQGPSCNTRIVIGSVEDRVELSGVALIGPPPRSAATQARVERESLEVLDSNAEALGECLHALAAATLAAHGAVREGADRPVGEAEARHHVVLTDGIPHTGRQAVGRDADGFGTEAPVAPN